MSESERRAECQTDLLLFLGRDPHSVHTESFRPPNEEWTRGLINGRATEPRQRQRSG